MQIMWGFFLACHLIILTVNVCFLGDVYIQPTQDTKNPVIYGVFSVSGWVTDNFLHLSCSSEESYAVVSSCGWYSFPPQPVGVGTLWYGNASPQSQAAKTKQGCECSSSQRNACLPYRSDLIAGCHRINSISLTCIQRQQQERHNKHVLINAFEKQILRLFQSSL